MEIRLTQMSDLTQLKSVFRDITEEMTRVCGKIWNDYYPCELFEDDIKRNEIYVLMDNDIVAAAIVLCRTNPAEEYIEWEKADCPVLYVERLGVNVNYQHRGIAQKMLGFAESVAREINAEYLRLFVVDRNFPAIRLYEKCGFKKGGGIYEEYIDEGIIYNEYGMEKRMEEK